MATPRKKKARPRRKKKKPQSGWFRKIAWALLFMGLGAALYAFFLQGVLENRRAQSSTQIDSTKVQQTVKKMAPEKPPQPSQPIIPEPPFEIYPEKEPAIEVEAPLDRELPPDTLPRIAIIIDDLGQDKRIAQKFLDLPGPLTLSVLPHLPHTRLVADTARAQQWEVMVHLPMEPQEYPSVNPGPGALLASMVPDVLIAQLRKNLAAVPGAVGANNHMGSRLTAQSGQMEQVFSELKRHNLFFIDSRTSTDSVALATARLFKIPFGQRHVFLDHRPNRQFIEKQLKLLQKKAQRYGTAIGIGHPYQVTWQVLSEAIPRLKETVRFIPASQAVKIIS